MHWNKTSWQISDIKGSIHPSLLDLRGLKCIKQIACKKICHIQQKDDSYRIVLEQLTLFLHKSRESRGSQSVHPGGATLKVMFYCAAGNGNSVCHCNGCSPACPGESLEVAKKEVQLKRSVYFLDALFTELQLGILLQSLTGFSHFVLMKQEHLFTLMFVMSLIV